MGGNIQGFPLCWYSLIRQAERSLIKVTKVENIFCSSSVLRKVGTEADSYYVDQDLFIRQANIAENPMLPAVFKSSEHWTKIYSFYRRLEVDDFFGKHIF